MYAQPATHLPPVTESSRRSIEWDIRYGPRNYLALIAAQATNSSLAFAALWLATRALGPAGYGGIAAMLAASQLIGQVAIQWSAVSVVRHGCEEFVETGRLAAAFWTRWLILLPNLLIAIAVSPWWLPPIAGWLHIPPRACVLVVAHLVATTIWIHVQHALQAAKLPRVQAALLALERAQIVLVMALLTLSGTASLLSVAWAYILAPILGCAIGLWRIRAFVYPGICLDRPLLKRMLVFSLPLIPCCLIGYLSSNYLDAFFITHLLSVTDLGIYAVAYQLAGTVMQLPLLAGSLLLPLFVTLHVNNRDRGMVRFLGELLPLITLLWSIACVLIAVIGGQLVPFVFGPQYREVRVLLWPLMAASALAGPWLIGYAPYVSSKSATSVCTLTGIASACTNVALNALLIPRFGLDGCAWATVAAYGASVSVGAYWIHRRVPLRRTWTMQATFPALLGAAYATWQVDNLSALVVTILAAGLIAYIYRGAIAAGIRTLEAIPS